MVYYFMKSWIQRDKKKRHLFLVNESKRKSLKSLIYNRNLPFKIFQVRVITKEEFIDNCFI